MHVLYRQDTRPGAKPYTDWHGSGAQCPSIKTTVGQEMTEDTTCSVNACDYNRPDNLVRCVR
ncbi:hypothetical protein A8B78_02445 [Jannaschia sp. EhC01]|nr:hypothetical protein A8B78_02445 [Jannaschia sp. EhC01]